LPPSFDLVVLGKKERNAVIACGKNPDRKESDVLDGRAINTDWRGVEATLEPGSPESAPAPSRGVPEANMDVALDGDAEQEQNLE